MYVCIYYVFIFKNTTLSLVFQYYNKVFRIENIASIKQSFDFRLCQTMKLVLQNNIF